MNVISTRNLSKTYGRRIGVQAVDLNVDEGTIFGFLGPNGAGKTTLIRLLLGFLRPTAGEASVFGLDCWRGSHVIKRDVGYLPGDLRPYPWMSVTSAVAVSCRIRGRDFTQAALDLAGRLRLDASLRVRSMSRGMRQKLGLILALAHDPKLIVLDEPTAGLDPLMQDELMGLLRERATNGRTVFFSSHTLSEVEALCDRIAIVREGSVVAHESLEALRRQARRTVTILFDSPDAAAETRPPDALDVRERTRARWRCELTGTAPELVKWAADQPIRDLTIGKPDLETLFRRYYERDETESES